MKIVIVDYGMGNIKSLMGAFRALGHDAILSNDFDILTQADKIILPGVGNFNKAMYTINSLGLNHVLKTLVLDKNVPILGICLGMQLLGLSSNESGFNKGLGLVEGVVERFNNNEDFKIPHVGFNQVEFSANSQLYSGLSNNSDFYFTHSYRMMSKIEIGQAYCSYIDRFVASFEFNNICGVQFHPELSQNNGLTLLSNFLKYFNA